VPNGTSASTKPLARPVTRDVSSFITGADAEGNHKEIPGNSPPDGSCRGLQGFPGHEEQPQSLAIFHSACRALRRCQRMGKDLCRAAARLP